MTCDFPAGTLRTGVRADGARTAHGCVFSTSDDEVVPNARPVASGLSRRSPHTVEIDTHRRPVGRSAGCASHIVGQTGTSGSQLRRWDTHPNQGCPPVASSGSAPLCSSSRFDQWLPILSCCGEGSLPDCSGHCGRFAGRVSGDPRTSPHRAAPAHSGLLFDDGS